MPLSEHQKRRIEISHARSYFRRTPAELETKDYFQMIRNQCEKRRQGL